MPEKNSNSLERLRERGMRLGARTRGGQKGLRALAASGLLHPLEPKASHYQALLDGMGASRVDYGLLFMAQAHLWGGWIPLLQFRPDLARTLAPRRPLFALAVTEPESGSDVYAMKSRCRKTRGGWLLSGEKTYITNGPLATHFLVLTADTGGAQGALTAFLIPARTPGLKLKKLPDRFGLFTAEACAVSLRNVRLGEDAVVGRVGGGGAVFRTAMLWERSLILSPAPGRLERLKRELLLAAGKKLRFGAPLAEQPRFRERVQRVEKNISELRAGLANAAANIDSGGNAMVASMDTKVQGSRLYEEASRILFLLGGKEAFWAGSALEVNYRDSLTSHLYSGPNEVLEELLEKIRAP